MKKQIMTDKSSFDQRGQKVDHQINVAGDFIQEQPIAPPIPHQVPSPPRDFSGREDELNELIYKFDRGATITGLRGMGGIGKTALALVLADRIKDRFPDGQLFLDMLGTSKSPLKPEDAMAHVIRSYIGAETRLPSDLNGLGGFYRTVLSGKSTLILLDNAANREQVESLLPPDGSALLITSRNKFALSGMEEKDLDVLPLEDAKKLLLEIAGRIGENAKVLAKLCGCLPLALRNAAYALKERQNIGVADYVKRLEDTRKRLDLVEASFNLSYELLNPEVQRLWCLLSVFPADFDLAGAATVWERDQCVAKDALGDLVKWSLVDFLPYPIGEGGRYRQHDLARDFANSNLDAAARMHAQWLHAEHYKNALSAANAFYHRGGNNSIASLMLIDYEWTNIQAGQAWSVSIMNGQINQSKHGEASAECTAALRLANSYPNAGFLVLDLYLHPYEQIHWLEAAIVAAQQLKDRKMECTHLGNLGLAYLDQGDYLQAIEFLELSLGISREINDQHGECADLSNLGIAYKNIGNFRCAIEFYEQALPIARKIRDLRSEGAILGNLGVANAALGETYKAIEFFEQHLAISIKNGDLRGESDALGNLGLAYAHLGMIQKSIGFYRQSLTINRKIGDKQSESKALGNLGNLAINFGETGKATKYYEQALKISCEIGDRQGEGNCLSNLGVVFYRLGQRERAIDYMKAALSIFDRIESPYARQASKLLSQWQGDENPK